MKPSKQQLEYIFNGLTLLRDSVSRAAKAPTANETLRAYHNAQLDEINTLRSQVSNLDLFAEVKS